MVLLPVLAPGMVRWCDVGVRCQTAGNAMDLPANRRVKLSVLRLVPVPYL